jgi:hypothetical protein
MKILSNMIWIELRKALRSKVPLFTAIASLFMPLGIAFLVFVSQNPEIARQMGLISTKATLIADTAATWPAYLGMFAQILGLGGLMLTVMIAIWVFGREFSDGTLKDLLAVPIRRGGILLAKFIVVAIYSIQVKRRTFEGKTDNSKNDNALTSKYMPSYKYWYEFKTMEGVKHTNCTTTKKDAYQEIKDYRLKEGKPL